jgi:hypothetical protein
VRIADNTQYDHLALFLFSTLFSIAVNQRTITSIKADFDEARLIADMKEMQAEMNEKMPNAEETAPENAF